MSVIKLADNVIVFNYYYFFGLSLNIFLSKLLLMNLGNF